jgi:hypothetical protein
MTQLIEMLDFLRNRGFVVREHAAGRAPPESGDEAAEDDTC